MAGKRLFIAALVLIMGLLQAWDSGILQASPAPQALTLAGIGALVLAALRTRTRGGYFAVVLAAGALLTVARVISPTPLPELLLILVMAFPGMLYLFRVPQRET